MKYLLVVLLLMGPRSLSMYRHQESRREVRAVATPLFQAARKDETLAMIDVGNALTQRSSRKELRNRLFAYCSADLIFS
jgi:hypothetical protein